MKPSVTLGEKPADWFRSKSGVNANLGRDISRKFKTNVSYQQSLSKKDRLALLHKCLATLDIIATGETSVDNLIAQLAIAPAFFF